MTDNHPLNADAIYAAMAWLRDYAESEEGQAALRTLLNEKAAKANMLRAAGHAYGRVVGENATVHLRPVFAVSDATKEEIYPDDSVSVDVGIELARSLIWGPPGFASVMLKDADFEDPMIAALSRFVADLAN